MCKSRCCTREDNIWVGNIVSGTLLVNYNKRIFAHNLLSTIAFTEEL